MGAGISRQDQLLSPPEQGQGWAEQLGIQGVFNGPFPAIIIDPWNSYARNQAQLPTLSTTFLYNPALSWTRGKHNFKFGAEIRKLQNNFRIGDDSGTFNFSRNTTALPGLQNTTGNVLASFLLGTVNSGSLRIQPFTATRHSYYAGYVQDDYKITQSVTLNLGLRYEVYTPMTEAYDRMSIVDPNEPNPRADGRPGAYVFAGDCDVCTGTQRLVNNDKIAFNNWGPRVGIAWRLQEKLVFRSAYGISYFPGGALGGSNAKAPSTGFSTTAVFTSLDGGITYPFNWEDGFPQNFDRPPLRNPGFNVNGGAAMWNPGGYRPGYTQSMNAGFQYQLAPTWLVDISWVGNKATRLVSGQLNFNQVDSDLLSLGNLLTLPIDDPAVRAAGFGRPYPSFPGTSSLAQALRPFPQFIGIGPAAQSGNIGNSSYHSLQFKIEKEFDKGLWFLTSYTWQKALTDSSSTLAGFFSTSARDQFNRGVEKALAVYDVPHRLVTAFNYELPFGKSKQGLAGKLLGGWQINAILSYQAGVPLMVSQNNASPIFAGKQMPNLLTGVQLENDKSGADPAKGFRAVNINAFQPTGRFEIGNAPALLPARAFSVYNEDFGIMKRTYITETMNVEFRFEMFNAFNRTIFGVGGLNVDSPTSFAVISGQANAPRSGQVALKFNF
jgi:hypothetical protein